MPETKKPLGTKSKPSGSGVRGAVGKQAESDELVAAIAAAIALVERDFGAGSQQRHDAEIAAVIAAALALAETDVARVPVPPRVTVGLRETIREGQLLAGPSPWLLSGLMRQMAARSAPSIKGRQN